MVCLSLAIFGVVACGGDDETTTTAAPTQTTAAPTETTAAPTETTAAPTETTAAPTETTVAVQGPPEPIKIAFFSYDASAAPMAVLQGLKDEAAKVGNVEIVLIQGDFTSKTQETQFQDAMTSGKYAAYVLEAADGVRMQPLVAEAGEKGMLGVMLDATLDDPRNGMQLENRPGLLCTMGYPLENQGGLFAEAILKACAAKNGEGKPAVVGIMAGVANFPIDSLRVDKIKEVLAQHANITVVDMPPGGYAAPSAQKATLDFLQSRKDIDVMMIFADQMIMGVIAALEQSNLVPGKDVYLVGQGGSVEGVNWIKEGKMFGTLRLYPYTAGGAAVDVIADKLNGKTVPEVRNFFETPPNFIYAETLTEYPDFVGEWSFGE
jgi:ABC-type sugar transport system substrate-binding protein